MKVSNIDILPWDVPMRAPYRSARRITTVAHNVLVVVRLEDGSPGYGESAPATYVTGETREMVLSTARAVAQELVGRDAETAAALVAERLAGAPGACGALEMALADAAARARGIPLYRHLGGDAAVAPRLATDLSLPILPAPEAAQRAARAAADGFRALKIKVGGGDVAEDLERVRAVAVAAPEAVLRLDGNQGFTAESALRFAEALCADPALMARMEMFEQPTPAGDDAALAFVAQRLPFPVFADESVHTAEDARRLLGRGACSGVVLKLAKGGFWGTLAIARAAHEAGGHCLFGCMMETRVAIGAALHLALALGPAVTHLDLDSHLLVDDTGLVTGGLQQEGDTLIVDAHTPGLGLVARQTV